MTHEPAEQVTTKRRSRWPLVIVVLLAAQALAVVGYFSVEERRTPALDEDFSFEPMNQPLPPLTLERPNKTLTLPNSGEDALTLLHVWASWCKPCREELPTLLALEDDLSANLVLASSDETWPVIEHFFDDEPVPGTQGLPLDLLRQASIGRVALVRNGESWDKVSWDDAEARLVAGLAAVVGPAGLEDQSGEDGCELARRERARQDAALSDDGDGIEHGHDAAGATFAASTGRKASSSSNRCASTPCMAISTLPSSARK